MVCIALPLVKRSLLLLCTFVALVYCIIVPGMCIADDSKEEAFLDAQTLVDGWEASYCNIDSLKLRCTKIVLDEKGQNPRGRRLTQFLHIERIQDGNKFLVRYTSSPQGIDVTDDYNVNSFDGSIGREYLNYPSGQGPDNGTIYQGLRGRGNELMNLLADFLGSTPSLLHSNSTSQEEPLWMEKLKPQYPQGIPVFIEYYNRELETGEVQVHPYLESVAGESCHVLELSNYGASRTYWFAHEKGMLPMKTKYTYNTKVVTKEAKEITSVTTDTGILWYPRVIMEEHIAGPNHSFTSKLTIDEYVPYFKAPAETFSYVFPNGTRVWDKIQGLQYTIGPSELETVMTSKELDILESGPAADETMPVSREMDNESEEPEDVHTDVAQEQPAQTSSNDESQETENHLMLWLLGIVVAASALLLIMRVVLFRKKTT